MGDLVSVIVPSYNRARLLPRAINSVLAQTHGNLELIVVDDGSDDDTPAVLARYGGRLTAVRQARQGAAQARNRGLAEARGEFIAFLDSDDWWAPAKLADQLRALAHNPRAGVCYTWFLMADERGRWMRAFTPAFEGDVFEALYRNNFLVTPNVLARRACFWDGPELVRRFDPRLAFGEDWRLWLELALAWPFCRVPRFHVAITDHPQRVYKTGQVEQIQGDLASIEAELRTDPRFAVRLEAMGPGARALPRVRDAYLNLLRGRRLGALAAGVDALRVAPFHVGAYRVLLQAAIGLKPIEVLLRPWRRRRTARLDLAGLSAMARPEAHPGGGVS